MSGFLTDEWITEAHALLADLPVQKGVDGVVQFAVTGGPDGKIQLHVEIESGRVNTIATGKHAEPGCTVTLTHVDALDLLNGELSAEVAFMTGQAKVEGDHRVWLLDLLPFRRHAEVTAAIEKLRDSTSA